MSDSLWSYGRKPARFLCPCNSLGKNAGGLPFPPPRDRPNPGMKSVSLESPALAIRFFTIRAAGQSQSPHSLLPLSSLGVYTFVLYICVSISALQISSSVSFYRCHIYMLLDSICFSLSGLLYSVWQSLGPPKVCANGILSLLLMASIPSYICITSFSIPLLMDI